MEAAFGFPHYQMHRADLLDALVHALPSERLHIGHRFTALADHGDHVEAAFENGTHIRVDLLVGPTASIRRCVALCSVQRSRISLAALPIVA